MNPLLKCSDMACDSKGITQFYLPPTHEPYLPLLPSCRAMSACILNEVPAVTRWISIRWDKRNVIYIKCDLRRRLKVLRVGDDGNNDEGSCSNNDNNNNNVLISLPSYGYNFGGGNINSY